jgi:broad specificity phosphatase PhoE
MGAGVGVDAETRTGKAKQRWPAPLWIVRHGESSGNVARDAAHAAGLADIAIDMRDVDVPLSDLGDRQTEALGRWFADLPKPERPSVVLSSPYMRAQQTDEIITQVTRTDDRVVKTTHDERLREKEFGILDRLTRTGIEQRYPDEANRRACRKILLPTTCRRELGGRCAAASERSRLCQSALRWRARAHCCPPSRRFMPALPSGIAALP